MTQRKRKSSITFGTVIISLGLILKAVHITAGAFLAVIPYLSLISVCLLNSGLCVFAYEKRSVTSFFAVVSAFCGILGVIRFESEIFTYSFFFVSYLAYALMLMSMKSKRRTFLGLLLLLTAAVLLMLSFTAVSAGVLFSAIILDFSYLLMLLGLFVR